MKIGEKAVKAEAAKKAHTKKKHQRWHTGKYYVPEKYSL